MDKVVEQVLPHLAESLGEVLDSRAEFGLLTPDELVVVLKQTAVLTRLAEALMVRLLQAGELVDLTAYVGMTSLAAQVSHWTGVSPAAAKRVALVVRDGEHVPAVSAALDTGRVGVEQAAAIVSAVLPLPDGVQEPAAEALLEYADTFNARSLAKLGKQIHTVVDPDHGDAILEAQLAAEERAHDAAVHFTASTRADGAYCGTFTVDAVTGAMLEKALHALTNPDLPEGSRISRDGLSRGEVRGHAFVNLVRHLDPRALPAVGGVNATVVVTMSLDQLRGDASGGALVAETGEQLSATAARQLACAAGVIPMVLGGRSEPLDLGRERRLFTRKQRLALEVHQGGVCAIEGCERPTAWCEAHHLNAWSHGGTTNVSDGVLICKRHHTLIHQDHLTPVRTRPGRIKLTLHQGGETRDPAGAQREGGYFP